MGFGATAGSGGLASSGSGAAKILLLGLGAFGTTLGALGRTDDVDPAVATEDDEDGVATEGFADKGGRKRTEGVGCERLDWIAFVMEVCRGRTFIGLRFGIGAKLNSRLFGLGTVTFGFLSMTLSTTNFMASG